MKYCLLISLFVLTAVCQATLVKVEQTPRRSPHVVKKIVKRAAHGFSADYYRDHFSKLIITDCLGNGASKNQTDKLKEDFDGIGKCLGKKRIFVESKEKYLEHFKECSKSVIKDAKQCLPEHAKHMPDLIFNIVKSLISFLYDDFELIGRTMGPCLRNLKKDEATESYHLCLAEEAEETSDDVNNIRDDAKKFCIGYIRASQCLPNAIKEYCKDSDDLKKLREDFMKAVKTPCMVQNGKSV